MPDRTPQATELSEQRFPEGTVLFREGDDSQDLYVLLSGEVRVSRSGAEITTIGEPGDYFGEMSSLLGQPRTATVTTTADSTFLVVPPDRVPELFGNTPQLALKMARVLAARLAQTTKDLSENWAWQAARESGEEKP